METEHPAPLHWAVRAIVISDVVSMVLVLQKPNFTRPEPGSIASKVCSIDPVVPSDETIPCHVIRHISPPPLKPALFHSVVGASPEPMRIFTVLTPLSVTVPIA